MPESSPDTLRLPTRPSTLPYAYSDVPGNEVPGNEVQGSNPLPSVGDYWDLDHPDPLPIAEPIIPTSIAPAPLVRPTFGVAMPYVPVYVPVKTAPLTSWAYAAALSSIPLLLLCGAGAIVGFIAVILGIAGVAQVSSSERYRGTGRAATSIAIGLTTTIVGTPFLALTIGLIDAFG